MWRLLNFLLAFTDVLTTLSFTMVSKCPLCDNLYTIDHFFAGCQLSNAVWFFFFWHFRFDLQPDTGLSALLNACWLPTVS